MHFPQHTFFTHLALPINKSQELLWLIFHLDTKFLFSDIHAILIYTPTMQAIIYFNHNRKWYKLFELITGSIKWYVQELLAQSSGEQ